MYKAPIISNSYFGGLDVTRYWHCGCESHLLTYRIHNVFPWIRPYTVNLFSFFRINKWILDTPRNTHTDNWHRNTHTQNKHTELRSNTYHWYYILHTVTHTHTHAHGTDRLIRQCVFPIGKTSLCVQQQKNKTTHHTATAHTVDKSRTSYFSSQLEW